MCRICLRTLLGLFLVVLSSTASDANGTKQLRYQDALDAEQDMSILHEDAMSQTMADLQLMVVKLRPRQRRTKAEVEALAEKWSLVFSSRHELHKVSSLGKDKLAIQILAVKDVPLVRDFVLAQYEVYEVEINKETYRRSSDSETYAELKKRLVGEVKQLRRRKIQSRTIERVKGKRGGTKGLSGGRSEL